jgi:hypothetical protein
MLSFCASFVKLTVTYFPQYISACLPLQLYRSESTCADSTSMTIFQALLTTVWVWRPDFAQYL